MVVQGIYASSRLNFKAASRLFSGRTCLWQHLLLSFFVVPFHAHSFLGRNVRAFSNAILTQATSPGLLRAGGSHPPKSPIANREGGYSHLDRCALKPKKRAHTRSRLFACSPSRYKERRGPPRSEQTISSSYPSIRCCCSKELLLPRSSCSLCAHRPW